MSFQVVIAKDRRVCTCICSHHHRVNDKRRCALFIEPGQPMAESMDTAMNARRCMSCAVEAGIVGAGAAALK